MEEQVKGSTIVEITVELDRNSYKHHLRFALFRWPSILLFSLVPLSIAWAIFWPEKLTQWIVVAVIYTFLYMCVLLSSKPLVRVAEESRQLPTTYTFYENVLQTQGGMLFVRTLELLQYELFGKCYETKHAFYMTAPRRGTIILDKNCFGEAEAAALRELFAREFGKNFKSKV